MSNGTGVAVHKQGVVAYAHDFEAFLREQRGMLLHFLRRRVDNEADAQDAVQESFTRMLRYAQTQPATAWKPLLYRIAVNVANDQARRRMVSGGAKNVPLDSETLVSPEPSQEQIAVQDQEVAMIRAVIMNLPPKCRQVYLLHRLRGMSYAEIAAHCGISRKTVEMHMSRALSALREAASRHNGDA